MAFPGTFNFSYYQGDRYEFVVRPKQSNGEPYDLTDFSSKLTIATARGSSSAVFSSPITGTVDEDASTITVAIAPDFGINMTGASYVYDLEIYTADRSEVYTILTGTIAVTRDITNTLAGT